MISSLPTYITKYFWGDDLQELDLKKNKEYIIQTILEKGDQKAIQWLLSEFDKDTLRQLISQIKLSKKSANFWGLYFS